MSDYYMPPLFGYVGSSAPSLPVALESDEHLSYRLHYVTGNHAHLGLSGSRLEAVASEYGLKRRAQ